MAEAFVYTWINVINGKSYIGAHKGDPNDGYICSSKYMINEYNMCPNNFFRVILATGSLDEMFNLEKKILAKLNVKNSNFYYNMSNGDGQFVLKYHTPETIMKISKAQKGRPFSAERKLRMIGRNPSRGHTGKTHSIETKEKIRQAKLGKPSGRELGWKHSAESKEKIKIARSKQIFSIETRKKFSERNIRRWEKWRIENGR